jgi:phosphatidate cytidylyltransferase
VKETITRSIFGLIFVALIVLSFLFTPYAYLVLFSLLCAAAGYEFYGMVRKGAEVGTRFPLAVLSAVFFILAFFVANRSIPGTWLLFPPGLLLAMLLVRFLRRKIPAASILSSTGGFLYLAGGFSMMHLLTYPAGMEYTRVWILCSFFLLWTNDTMAYVSGKLAGRNKIWPSLSPGKTWEGSIGGAVFSLVLAIVLSRQYQELDLADWIILALIVIVFGTIGDFLESSIKRRAGVKDSGRFMPGHGGILDRFDSFLLSVPVLAVYISFVL